MKNRKHVSARSIAERSKSTVSGRLLSLVSGLVLAAEAFSPLQCPQDWGLSQRPQCPREKLTLFMIIGERGEGSSIYGNLFGYLFPKSRRTLGTPRTRCVTRRYGRPKLISIWGQRRQANFAFFLLHHTSPILDPDASCMLSKAVSVDTLVLSDAKVLCGWLTRGPSSCRKTAIFHRF
jgi:hypothetical protein